MEMKTASSTPAFDGTVDSKPCDAIQLYKSFLAAAKARDVVRVFYKLRTALGLRVIATGNADTRYQVLKEKILPLCNGFFLGKRPFMRLEEKRHTMNPGTTGLSVTVVGCGPVGLRTAIELQLLGQEVTIVEQQILSKVDRRSNVLKLWNWAFDDLHSIGVHTNHMNGKGNKHIRTDELQVELIRIALLLGINFRFGSEFVNLEPLPIEERGTLAGGKWCVMTNYTRSVEEAVSTENVKDFAMANFGVEAEVGCTVGDMVALMPSIHCHAVVGAGGVHDPIRAKFDFDVVTTKIADAVGLVTFFKNGQTAQERAIDEVLWAKQFNNPPIKHDLQGFGAEIENLVYFQTPNLHYLVMTPTRSNLINLGILSHEQGLVVKSDTLLEEYSRNVARVVGLPKNCEFQNPNVSAKIFDFSERTHTEQASTILRNPEDESHYALLFLVGDALLEPFWPEGLGINRGFHSGFDASWCLRNWGKIPLEGMMHEREQMYAAQKEIGPATDVLKKSPYSTDPATRYSLQVYTPEYMEPRPERALSLPNLPSANDRSSISLDQLKRLRCCSSRTVHGISVGLEMKKEPLPFVDNAGALNNISCTENSDENSDIVMVVESVNSEKNSNRQSISLDQLKSMKCCTKQTLMIQADMPKGCDQTQSKKKRVGFARTKTSPQEPTKINRMRRLTKRAISAPMPIGAKQPMADDAEFFLQEMLSDCLDDDTEKLSQENLLQRLLAESFAEEENTQNKKTKRKLDTLVAAAASLDTEKPQDQPMSNAHNILTRKRQCADNDICAGNFGHRVCSISV